MDRPTLQLKWFQEHFEKRDSTVDQLRADTIVNYVLYLEQELTVRDELLNSIYLDMTQLGEVLPMGETTFNKLRDFIKQRNEQG